jgi:NADH-quinone oxidoreductase subunit E
MPRRVPAARLDDETADDAGGLDLTKIAEIIAGTPDHWADLVGVLQRVQAHFGYLPEVVLDEVARLTGVPRSRIYGVVTFYAQFSTAPRGRHRVCVCQGTACHVLGGHEVLRAVERTLSIAADETTPDLDFSLETVACLGACSFAPVMTVDGQYFGKMRGSRVGPIVNEFRSGERDDE